MPNHILAEWIWEWRRALTSLHTSPPQVQVPWEAQIQGVLPASAMLPTQHPPVCPSSHHLTQLARPQPSNTSAKKKKKKATHLAHLLPGITTMHALVYWEKFPQVEPLFLEPTRLWGHVSRRPVGLQRAEFRLPSTSKERRKGGRQGGRKGSLVRDRFYSAPGEESQLLCSSNISARSPGSREAGKQEATPLWGFQVLESHHLTAPGYQEK